MRKITTAAAAILLSSFVAGTAAAAEPDDVIIYRHMIMEAIGAHATSMGLIAEGKVPHEGAFLAHAEMLASASALAPAAFRENTTGKGREKTTAKPEIWSDWADFEKGLEAMEAKSREIASLAKSGGVKAAAAELPALFRTCKGCHDDYRTK